MLSALGAECAEWPTRGFIRRKKVGSKQFCTLCFSLDDFHCEIPSPISSVRSRRTATKPAPLGMATDPPRVAEQAETPKSTSRLQRTRSKFTQEENARLIDLKEGQILSWGQTKKSFPRRSIGSLQVHYCTKLKNRGSDSPGTVHATRPAASQRSVLLSPPSAS